MKIGRPSHGFTSHISVAMTPEMREGINECTRNLPGYSAGLFIRSAIQSKIELCISGKEIHALPAMDQFKAGGKYES